ncbi:glycosyltransferase family 4 protein [Candidatus Gottesmanbacteria bacterium]|nr:glycosyltransferase family 4 protein [Candidatus Gottesmanbacteria bacterium]
MRIGILIPTLYMSDKYKDMIFAPKELVLSLSDGMVARGHDVYLFTAPDVATKAKLVAGDPKLLEDDIFDEKLKNAPVDKVKWGTFYNHKHNFELDITTKAYKMGMAKKLDIIHSYHDMAAHFFNDLTGMATVYTLHDPIPTDPKGLAYWLYQKYSSHNYISISNAFRNTEGKLNLNFVGTVYHGIDLNNYSFQEVPSDYLLFMGRLVPEKGLDHAIAAALSLNMRLEIGSNFPDKDDQSDYFLEKIKPHLQNPLILEPGIVSSDNKIILYKQARTLLFPILWEEPFGMVMVEAMACGTPVVAYARGSVPEIVQDGVTGFIVNSQDSDKRGDWIVKKTGIEGLVEAVQRLNTLSGDDYKKMRISCRKVVEEKFTVKKMVVGYEQVYQRILNLSQKS